MARGHFFGSVDRPDLTWAGTGFVPEDSPSTETGTTSGGDSLVCLSGRAVTVTATFNLTTEIQSSCHFFFGFPFFRAKKKFKKKSNFLRSLVGPYLSSSQSPLHCLGPTLGGLVPRSTLRRVLALSSILLSFTSYHSCVHVVILVGPVAGSEIDSVRSYTGKKFLRTDP